MFRSALLASVCVMLVTSAALADAPSSLAKGNWSLSYTAGSGTEILVGYQLKDMTKVGVNFGVSSVEVGDESNTEFNIGVQLHYYLAGMSNQYFSPFLGGSFGYADSGIEGEDGDIEFTARFGGEAFPIQPLSVGGYVGFGYQQDNQGAYDPDANEYVDVTNLGIIRSAFFVSLYW